MNNRSIPSMHAERQITDLSDKHSFTLYPSLSPYRRTELLTEEQIHSLRGMVRAWVGQNVLSVTF